MMKKGKSERRIPVNFLIEWTAQAQKMGKEGMIILLDKEKGTYFPHYSLPEFGLWDSAILLEKEGYEIVEIHVFKETNAEEKTETINKNN